MGGVNIPLVALQDRPAYLDPMASYQKMAELQQQLKQGNQNLAAGQQQLQSGALDIQAKQRGLQDQQTMQQVLSKNNGDVEKSLSELAGKVTPQTFMGLAKFHFDTKEQLSKIADNDLKVQQDQHDRTSQLLDYASKLPDDQYAQQWPTLALRNNEINPQHPLDPNQPIPKAQLSGLGVGLQTQEQYLKQEAERREQATAVTEQAKNMAETSKLAAEMPSGPMYSPSDNALYSQATNPNTKDTAQGRLAQAMLARKQQEKIATASAEGQAKASLASPARDAARSDRSYQFHTTQLDKVGAPIEQAVQRFGRLADTINQATPQADALVAPELLTVMAGGAGSGLRMNEAEISRIVGGRSNFESLQAALNKWQTDPSKALSITASQRQQIRSLMNEVQGKLIRKQNILDQARQDLINTDDPIQHRRVLADARKQLTQIDETSGASGVSAGAPPTGATHRAKGSDGKWHYTNAQGQDLGVAQ